MTTKENIIVTALRLFWTRGYRYISLVDVAKEVGITKGGIYHYFASKEELLRATIDYLIDRVEGKFIDIFNSERNFKEIIYAFLVDGVVEQYIKDLVGMQEGDDKQQTMHQLSLVVEVMKNFPDMHTRFDSSHAYTHGIIENWIKQSMAKGEVRSDLDGRDLATVITMIFNGQHAVKGQLEDREARKQIAEAVIKMMEC